MVPTTSLFGPPIDYQESPPAHAVESVEASLVDGGTALVQNFPADVGVYIEFLRHFGRPLDNYAGNSKSAAYSLHPAVNVVRTTRPDGRSERVQERGGELGMHSGRPYARTRPRLIAMFMREPGWRHFAPNHNGESKIVRWSDVLRRIEDDYPDLFDDDRRLLRDSPIYLQAQHLDEPAANLPILYPPRNPRGEWEIAARIPPIRERLYQCGDQLPDGQRWIQAVDRFIDGANLPSVYSTYRLDRGDLVLLDNDRFGHGRHHVESSRSTSDGEVELNPRELWSVTVE